MSRYGRSPRSSRKPNPILLALSALLLVAGSVALFSPSLIHQLIQGDIADLLVANAKLLLGVGIGLNILATVVSVTKSVREGKRLRAAAGGVSHSATAEVDSDIDWTPLKGGGANFRTQHLVTVSPSRLEVRASGQMILFCFAFMAIGGGVGGVFVFNGFQDGDLLSALMPGLIGLVFVLAGGLMLRSAGKRGVFDSSMGCYWRGFGKQADPRTVSAQPDWTGFRDIKALQLLSERVTSSSSNGRSSYLSYELNLVLTDGRRINVMDHGDLDSLRRDAHSISQLVGAPVLDRLAEAH